MTEHLILSEESLSYCYVQLQLRIISHFPNFSWILWVEGRTLRGPAQFAMCLNRGSFQKNRIRRVHLIVYDDPSMKVHSTAISPIKVPGSEGRICRKMSCHIRVTALQMGKCHWQSLDHNLTGTFHSVTVTFLVLLCLHQQKHVKAYMPYIHYTHQQLNEVHLVITGYQIKVLLFA